MGKKVVNMIYGKDIGKKFDKDGNVLHYPGNTVVADIVPGCSAYDVMSHLRQMIFDAGFEDTLCMLPEDSYHMTVIRGLNDKIRKDTHWPAALSKDTPMEQVDDYISDAIARAGLPGPARMKFHKVLPQEGCIIIQVVIKVKTPYNTACHYYNEQHDLPQSFDKFLAPVPHHTR